MLLYEPVYVKDKWGVFEKSPVMSCRA